MCLFTCQPFGRSCDLTSPEEGGSVLLVARWLCGRGSLAVSPPEVRACGESRPAGEACRLSADLLGQSSFNFCADFVLGC